MGSVTPKLAVVFLVPLAMGCGATDRQDEQRPLERPRVASTRGSAVVLSRDERVAVVTNRSAGVVTVFHLDPEKPLEQMVLGQVKIDMDGVPGRPSLQRSSEPWAAVIGADDDTAYVVSRFDQTVSRIVDLHAEPRWDGSLVVGSEPTAIAIAPSGKRLFVANWGEGTISVIWTPDFRATGKLNLSPAAARFLPGAAEERPALAHPRALAITDSGDDNDADETLYATEFFSMPREGLLPNDAGQFDRSRQGLVYRIPLGEAKVEDAITIAPVLDTGFGDPALPGQQGGCLPNQLYSAAADGGLLIVTSMCASPSGPLGASNVKTLVHPTLFAIDTQANEELAQRARVLTHEIDQLVLDSPEAAPPRVPLIPNDIAFAPRHDGTEARRACLTAMGADAVFCFGDDPSSGIQFIDLEPRDQRAGKLPVGIALSQRRPHAFVVNDNSQNVSLIDLGSSSVRWVESTTEGILHAEETLRSTANEGRQFFATGLDVWAFQGQGWASCESCHPDGLSDGITWFFARGPRRTLSTAGTYYRDGDRLNRRVMLWTGNIDEIHDIEGIVRSVAGGVGAVLWKYPGTAATNDFRIVYDGSQVPPGKPTSTLLQNLNGSLEALLEPPPPGTQFCTEDATVCDNTPRREWDLIDAYIQSVRAPLQPTTLDTAQVQRGAALFREGRCAACHGGPGWTLSRVFYTPGAANNGALPYSRPASITTEQLGLLRTETYEVTPELAALNPPGSSGSAPFRRWDPGARDILVHLYGKVDPDGYDSAKTHGNDQINCVLRAVGTFPAQDTTENKQGIVPAGSGTVVWEVRQDMQTLALGATGFNIPSLLGVAAGAPYFHAGNARTLEEVFDTAFAPHHQAFSPGFLTGDAAAINDLVAYLVSIDDNTATEPAPSAVALGFDPDLCAQAAGRIQ